MTRIVADLGNSRLKLGRLDPSGTLAATVAHQVDDRQGWARTLDDWGLDGESSWAISTVNPPIAAQLIGLLEGRLIESIRWFRSAADVPMRHDLILPQSAGADRALAVLAASTLHGPGKPGAVVSCGTALTVERIAADGTWLGGAIAPGLKMAGRALHRSTAQLPRITIRQTPDSWGNFTGTALEAGIFWGAVGAIRELLTRQSVGLEPPPWVVWTGGDAPALAPHVEGPEARIVPDLVLNGLVLAAFGGDGR